MVLNLGTIIAKCIDKHGLNVSAELLDYIKATGYKYSTKGAITVSVADVAVPKAKKDILAKAEEEVENVATIQKELEKTEPFRVKYNKDHLWLRHRIPAHNHTWPPHLLRKTVIP